MNPRDTQVRVAKDFRWREIEALRWGFFGRIHFLPLWVSYNPEALTLYQTVLSCNRVDALSADAQFVSYGLERLARSPQPLDESDPTTVLALPHFHFVQVSCHAPDTVTNISDTQQPR